MTTVYLLDDHEIVRRGIRDLLDAEPDLEVIGEAGTGNEALKGILETQPDVAILDVRLSDCNGIEVCREIRSQAPDIACVMLTSFADDDAFLGAVMAGAVGYILKQIRGSDLVGSIRRVARGESLLDPKLVARARSRLARERANNPLERLSPQERRILDLIAEGKTNREIAQTLFLAEKTVKNYVSNLLIKLGMKRRTEAAVFAVKSTQHDRRTDDDSKP